MKSCSRLSIFRTSLIFLILICSQNAYAYLDPGSGSLFFQALIGVLLGAVVTGKIWFGRVKAFLSDLFSGKKKNTE
jgi:hypothetical protein